MVDITISLAASEVTLEGGRGSLTASVTNRSATSERVVLAVYPVQAAEAPADPRAWATVLQPLREIGAGATEQYVVSFDAAALPAGSHQLKVVAYPADRAPEEYSDRGQVVTVVAPASPVPAAEPKRRWWLWVLAAVVLVAVIGVVVFLLTRPDGPDPEPEPTDGGGGGVVTIPDLVGLSQAEAEALVGDELELTRTLEGSDEPVGTVLRQEPPPGTEAELEDPVRIVVSGVLVPDVLGRTEAAARRLLAAEGFEVTVAQTRDRRADSPFSEADIGTVIRSEPGAGALAGRGDPVRISVLVLIDPA